LGKVIAESYTTQLYHYKKKKGGSLRREVRAETYRTGSRGSRKGKEKIGVKRIWLNRGRNMGDLRKGGPPLGFIGRKRKGKQKEDS